MACKFVFIIFVCAVYSSQAFDDAIKCKHPRVLLPIFSKININFTVEMNKNDSFKWTSLNDWIAITPLYESNGAGSHRAVVTVLTKEYRRVTARILAKHEKTGKQVHCEVILDVIHRLEVHTTTRELYLEEAPEIFELWAGDSQGNVFTTLEGVEFDWSITPVNDESKGWLPALRVLTFTESTYHEVPSAVMRFEAMGTRGHMVLLEGVNTGTAKVTVTMSYAEYKHIPPMEVYINVKANILLEPSHVYVLSGDTIIFHILQVKQGKLKEITLNNQYFLEVENSSIASITGHSVTGLKLGRTAVVLRDRNVPRNAKFIPDNAALSSSVPSAHFTVVHPVKLNLRIKPHNTWITVVGEKIEIVLDLFTSNGQKITLGPRHSVLWTLDDSLFHVIHRNENGTHLYGQAIQAGIISVFGTFGKLSAQEDLQIFNALVLLPQRVILPFGPYSRKIQEIQFVASGGDDIYVWHSSNADLLNINQNGLLTTVPEVRSGKEFLENVNNDLVPAVHASIHVSLAKNQKIQRHAEVIFLRAAKLEIVKYNFETALHDLVTLQIALYAYANGSYVPFTVCQNLQLELEFSNQIFEVENSTVEPVLVEGACHVLHLRSTAIGMTNVKLFYRFADRVLKDETTLAVFERLSVANPIEGKVILPIGSSRNVVYVNGPQRMYTLDAELTKHTQYDEDIIAVSEMKVEMQSSVYAFVVKCRSIGDTSLNFGVYNVLIASNVRSYISNVTIAVHCVKPRILRLYTTDHLSELCPLNAKNSLMHLKKLDDDFEIGIEVRDTKNRKLMNVSSLLIKWELVIDGERYPGTPIYHRRQKLDTYKGVQVPGEEFLLIKMDDVVQNFIVKGVVERYDEVVLSKQGIIAEQPPFNVLNLETRRLFTPFIEHEIRVMIVNSTLFPFDHVSIYMARNRRQSVSLGQGSGFYDLGLSNENVIRIEFQERDQQLVITPLHIGQVRITVTDRCVNGSSSHLSISVVSIGAVVVECAEHVEHAQTIEAIVRLYDSKDKLMSIDTLNLQMYELAAEIFNVDILTIKLGDQTYLERGEIRYLITGNNIGESKVVFKAGPDDRVITSDPVNIQVFLPLQLLPRNSTLVIGSKMQIYYHGGPQPDINIVYSVLSENIASIESGVVAALKLGETKIIGRCVMKNTRSNKEVVLSESAIDIHVVPMQNVKIKIPLTRISSGAIMPASVWGVPDISPMVLGTLQNIRIVWMTNQPDVVDIYNIFSDTGIEYGDRDLISVRIKALNPGKAKVQVTVTVDNNKVLTNFVEVMVFKALALESPKHISMDWILAPPRAFIQLKANVDGVSYQLDNSSKAIVKVLPDGSVRTQDFLGRDLIIAKTAEQTLPIGIEVKNIQYILISLEGSSLKLKHTETHIPRGINYILKVSLHDNVGNEFSHNIELVNALKYEVSNKDEVGVQIGDNMMLSINLLRDTNNMIAISLKDKTGVKDSEDYVKLSVAPSQHIYPTKTIFASGDVICFESPLTMASTWSSSDEHLVSIDRYTGVARILGNRMKSVEKAFVENGDKASGGFFKYGIEVRNVDVLKMLKTFDVFTGSQYRGHLVLGHHLQGDKSNNLFAKNLSTCSGLIDHMPVVDLFVCQLTSKHALGSQLLKNYKVTPIFDIDVGSYACQVDLTTTFNEAISVIQSNEVYLDLEAQLSNGLYSSIALKFVPGITVQPDSLLLNDKREQELKVIGLDKVLKKVEVRSSHPSILTVTFQTKSHGVWQYIVVVQTEPPTDEQLYVYVHSPLTEENYGIPLVNTYTMSDKCSVKFFESPGVFLLNVASSIGVLVTIIVVVGATVYGYILCFQQSGRHSADHEAYARNESEDSDSRHANTTIPKDSSRTSSPYSPIFNASRYSPEIAHGSPSLGNEGQVYGDTALTTPYKRINRRYL